MNAFRCIHAHGRFRGMMRGDVHRGFSWLAAPFERGVVWHKARGCSLLFCFSRGRLPHVSVSGSLARVV